MKIKALRQLSPLLAALLCSSVLAQPIVFDFTATVLTSNNVSASFGDLVTGTYTFDYGAANPSQSLGIPGSSDWYSKSYGGTALSLNGPVSYVFSSTAQVGNIKYATDRSNLTAPYNFYTSIQGGGVGYESIQAIERVNPTVNNYSYSDIVISGAPIFSSNGFPTFGPGCTGIGEFSNGKDSVMYTIKSITIAPVPEPETYGLLVAGISVLGVVARRHKKA